MSGLRTSVAVLAGSLLLVQAWLSAAVEAAPVAGSYQGPIAFDSGLGLLDEILRIDFVYDDGIAGTANGAESIYVDFLQSLTVRIGVHAWHYLPDIGESVAYLANDQPSALGAGTEDTLAFFSSAYTGPSLVAGAMGYTLSLFMSDTTPVLAPDALASDALLPAQAPDPANFSADFNTLVFGFELGDPGNRQLFVIQTSGVATVVPLPLPALLLAAALGALGAARARRAQVCRVS